MYNVIVLLALHLSPFFLLRNYSMILLGAIIVFDKTILNKTKRLISNYTFWMLLTPFLIYSFSIFYSNDIDNGIKEIEKKASLLLFPIIFGLISIKRKDFFIILKFSVLLISLLPIYGFINQWNIYSDTGDTGWFYNDNLVSIFNKQAVYYALYINTVIVILIYLWHKRQITTLLAKGVGVVVLSLLISAQYLLASRTSMLTTLIILSSYMSWLIIRKLNRNQGLILAGSSLLIIVALLFSFPKVINRYKSITNVEYTYDNPNPINHFNGEIKKENWNGLNTRLAIWNCAWEEFLNAPVIGYGIGGVQNQLVRNYKEKNFILGLNMNYNTHNQYLDILLTSGVIGLLLFVTFILFLAITALKTRSLLLLGFLGIFVISSLTENVFNRDQGVVFISLFTSLLIYKNKTLLVIPLHTRN